MLNSRNPFLIVGALLSALAALLHLGCIVFGAPWYRFFGAGERLAQLASTASWQPTVITAGIVAVLVTWSLYALSGAGVIPVLPYARTVLCAIAGIYLLRGFAGLPFLPFATGRSVAFWWWSSMICLAIGVIHLVGVRLAWNQL